MAILLCFYANRYPGATNTHPASCVKCILLGSNIAIPPFLTQVEMNLKEHPLINNYWFSLSQNSATQICARSHIKVSPAGQH